MANVSAALYDVEAARKALIALQWTMFTVGNSSGVGRTNTRSDEVAQSSLKAAATNGAASR